MAYLYVNADGITRPYSTITDAMATASGGDTIVIDPGVYVEMLELTKEVNIRGNTETPENDDIIIDPYPTFTSPSIYLNYAPSSAETIHIEGVTLRNQYPVNYAACFSTNVGQNIARYTSLIFNRCRFHMYNTSSNLAAIHLGTTYFDKTWFDHCEWELITGNTKQEFQAARWDWINDSRVLACVYEGAYECYSCGGGVPTVNNYVTTPTEGYGPAYSSDWYVPLDYPVVGYFDGYVMEEGSPVQRTINLYKRTNGEFLGTTSSNPSGYYYIETTFSGMHYVVCLDAPADPLYNDLIIGSAYPTAL